MLRLVPRGLQAREVGQAAKDVFPFPFLRCQWNPTARNNILTGRPLSLRLSVNLWVGFLNLSYSGAVRSRVDVRKQVCVFEPSVSQKRCLSTLWSKATQFLSAAPDGGCGDEASVRKLLRLGLDNCSSSSLVLPFDAGVPQGAANVSTEAVLAPTMPVMAKQCADPSRLLLSNPDFSEGFPRTFIWVSKSIDLMSMPALL
jgi:hypothetical protein